MFVYLQWVWRSGWSSIIGRLAAYGGSRIHRRSQFLNHCHPLVEKPGPICWEIKWVRDEILTDVMNQNIATLYPFARQYQSRA